MLTIHYVNGSQDSLFTLDPAKTALELSAFKADATIAALTAGKLATVDANGYVALAEDGAYGAGFIINDVAGYDYENAPAYASGKVPLVIGGGLVSTDALVDTDVAAADLLYISTAGNAGKLTNVRPADLTLTEGAPNTVANESSTPFGLARTANSADDLTVMVQF